MAICKVKRSDHSQHIDMSTCSPSQQSGMTTTCVGPHGYRQARLSRAAGIVDRYAVSNQELVLPIALESITPKWNSVYLCPKKLRTYRLISIELRRDKADTILSSYDKHNRRHFLTTQKSDSILVSFWVALATKLHERCPLARQVLRALSMATLFAHIVGFRHPGRCLSHTRIRVFAILHLSKILWTSVVF